jgi:CRP/FNR family transcriptional regulator, anaerobic regulatory protein
MVMGINSLKALVSKVCTIDEEAWSASEKFFKPRSLGKGEFFLQQNEVCRYVGFIEKGYVRLFYNVRDEEVTKDFNMELSFCGSYASFMLQEPSRFNVIAMEPVQLQVITRDNLLTLTDEYPAWQKFLRIAMQNMFIKKEMREALFLLSSPEERYADLMVNSPEWINRVPLKYLASYLGMTAETLSRVRKKMV